MLVEKYILKVTVLLCNSNNSEHLLYVSQYSRFVQINVSYHLILKVNGRDQFYKSHFTNDKVDGDHDS